MRVEEAKRRRLLQLAGGLGLALLPVALAGPGLLAPSARLAAPPRAAAPAVGAGPLELAAPDLVGEALGTRLASDPREAQPPPAAPLTPALHSGLVALAAVSAAPVAEPPRLVLLALAAGLLVSCQRTPKRGRRFARNASTPSMASASSRLSAITAPASR